MRKPVFVFLGTVVVIILIILTSVIYGYLTSKSDGNIVSQQTLSFLKSRPNSTQLKQFLKKNKIDFDVYRNRPTSHSASISSIIDTKEAAHIVFVIYDVKKSWCGHFLDYYTITFNKEGHFLSSENSRKNIGCFDF